MTLLMLASLKRAMTMKAEGYDIVITEKEMRVLADHRREEFKDWMRPLFAPAD